MHDIRRLSWLDVSPDRFDQCVGGTMYSSYKLLSVKFITLTMWNLPSFGGTLLGKLTGTDKRYLCTQREATIRRTNTPSDAAGSGGAPWCK